MAEGLPASCRSFEPSRLNKATCQNCNKLKESHGKPASSQELGYGLTRKGSGARVSRLRTVVKSGALSVAVQKGNDTRSRWNKRWIVLDSTGRVEYFLYDEQKDRSRDFLEGSFNLDTCGGMFVGESDTGEPFSTGLKFPESTLYFKAENRLEMDNWSRVLKPFVQAAQPFPSRRTSRLSSDSSNSRVTQSPNVSSGVGYVPSSGKGSIGRSVSLPRSAAPRSKTLGTDGEHVSVESFKLQMEKLKEENRTLSEQSAGDYARQTEFVHILEQELKLKNHQLKELEKQHCQCKDYQKAVIFQERELQEAKTNIRGLKKELEEAEKNVRQQKGKIVATGKELSEAKSDLQQADSIISIHKANIESLKGELGSLKQDVSTKRGNVSVHDEPATNQGIFTQQQTQANGDDREGDQTKDLETKLSFLMQKFKQNERELTIKGKELEKANESRSKVAKYTRSLLQELEQKLGHNETRLGERDNELVNTKLDLEYEREQRAKLEADKEQALIQLEKLREERKKVELSKEVVKLLDQAKEETAPVESVIPVEEVLVETGLEIFPEEEPADGSDDPRKEIAELKAALKSMESVVNQKESLLSDNQAILESTNTEIKRLREERNSLRHQLQVEKCDELTDLLKKKDSEIGSLKKNIRYLGDTNSDLSEKNRGLDERLQTVENELNESVEKEIMLQQENETRDEESTDFEENIAGLEEELSIAAEKIGALELKLAAASNADPSRIDADRNKVEGLQLSLRSKEKLLKEIEHKLSQKEEQVEDLKGKYESDLSNIENDRKNDQRNIRGLEQQLRNAENSLREAHTKLEEKGSELEKTARKFERVQEIQVDNSQVEELETRLIEKEETLQEYEGRLREAVDEIDKYQTKLIFLESQRKHIDEYVQELESKLRSMEEEVEHYKERLAAEEKAIDFEDKLMQKRANGDLNIERLHELEKKLVDAVEKIGEYEISIQNSNSKLNASEEKVVELAEELARRLKLEGETVQWIEQVENSLKQREVELNEAREVMTSKALELDKEKTNVLDVVELSRTYTKELEAAVSDERTSVRQLEEKLADERSKTSELHAKIEILSSSSADTPDGSHQTEELEARLVSTERQLEVQSVQIKALKKELEEQEAEFHRKLETERQSFEVEVQKMNEDSLRVSGAAYTEADELKLRLTSRVITLQSDISELKAAHQQETEQLKAHYKKLEQDRSEAILESSSYLNVVPEEANSSIQELEADMRLMVERYETHMEHLKASHNREMAKLKRSSDSGDGLQTEVVQLQTMMEGMNQKYMEEIETLKNEHADELDQLKKDLAVVLQASLSTGVTAARHADDSGNVPQLKARIRELESDMEELNRKYNEEIKAEREAQQREIEQTRQDMMTIIQAIRSEKYKLDSDAEEDASPKRARELQRELEKSKARYEAKLTQQTQEHEKQLEEIRINRGLITITGAEDTCKLHKKIKELEAELADMRQEFATELSKKEEKHGDEVNQLKVDMLVAIQVARSGSSSPIPAQPESQTVTDTISKAGMQLSLEEARKTVEELETKNKALKKEIAAEKEEGEKVKQKSDAAVMFGLRRNEDMSMKIYKMQKEMEATESKHHKEINLYKEAVEREKEKKGDVGDFAALASENDSLRLEIEECELNIEKRENVLKAEIQMYKDKFHKESVQNVEKLKYNIESLEGVIEELKLEHGKELEDLKEERERTMEEIKNRHEKEVEELVKEKSVVEVAPAVATLPTKDVKKEREKLRERELRIEELESLLNVKKRRHSEEIRKLRERLQQELQTHTDEIRDYRRRIRELERSRPRSDSGGLGMDREYKRKLEEQTAENATLKSSAEELKKQLEDLKKQLEDLNIKMEATSKATESHQNPGESRRPMSDCYPSGYSAFTRGTSQPISSLTKEPLRQVSSDSEPSYRTAQGGSNLGQQKSGNSEKSKTTPRQWSTENKWPAAFARQSSKIDSNSIGSVASRVALYQTAASKKKAEEKSAGKKP